MGDKRENPRFCRAYRRAILIASICATAPAQKGRPAYQNGACTLIINVDGFRNTKGVAGGTIFTTPNGLPEDNSKAYRLRHTSIDGNHAVLRFDNLPAGRYAVAVIHDE